MSPVGSRKSRCNTYAARTGQVGPCVDAMIRFLRLAMRVLRSPRSGPRGLNLDRNAIGSTPASYAGPGTHPVQLQCVLLGGPHVRGHLVDRSLLISTNVPKPEVWNRVIASAVVGGMWWAQYSTEDLKGDEIGIE